MKLISRIGISVLTSVLVTMLAFSPAVQAESQGNDYKGVADPFGDPANYEFAEDEREDKEFFHLGRYLMLGAAVGGGIFTGGLGVSTSPGPYVAGRLIYFFDKSLALEAGFAYSFHLDQVRGLAGGGFDYDSTITGFTAGFRYYFDTKSAPKAIAIANPYLIIGGGFYLRSQVLVATDGFPEVTDTNNSNFGGFGGGGVEFSIYRRHIYLGLDLRYHLIFFPDENETYGGKVADGERAGDYLTPAVTLTYNF